MNEEYSTTSNTKSLHVAGHN